MNSPLRRQFSFEFTAISICPQSALAPNLHSDWQSVAYSQGTAGPVYDSGLETETAEPNSGSAVVSEISKKSGAMRHFVVIGLSAVFVQLLLALALGSWLGLPLWFAHLVGFSTGAVFAAREYIVGDIPRSSNTCDQMEALGRYILISMAALAFGLTGIFLLTGMLHAAALQTLAMLVSSCLTYSAARLWVT